MQRIGYQRAKHSSKFESAQHGKYQIFRTVKSNIKNYTHTKKQMIKPQQRNKYV